MGHPGANHQARPQKIVPSNVPGNTILLYATLSSTRTHSPVNPFSIKPTGVPGNSSNRTTKKQMKACRTMGSVRFMGNHRTFGWQHPARPTRGPKCLVDPENPVGPPGRRDPVLPGMKLQK